MNSEKLLKSARFGAIRLITCVAVLLFCLPLHAQAQTETSPGEAAHTKALAESDYPSAAQCAGCHRKIYDEWSASSHAYAGISPMFHKFENAINALAPTIDSFCVRCHMSTGTALGEARTTPLAERSKVAREGVTCVTCHRVNTEYGRMNGERRINPAPIFENVYGPGKARDLDEVIANSGEYKIKTSNEGNGRAIHNRAVRFEQISESEFCVSCHQVAVNLGIKLEVVWDQFRASPAHAEGVTCQQCHMGRVPGVPSGFEQATAAVIGGKPVGQERNHYNHAFYGPGYSIAHPGVFPHNPDADEWPLNDWLQYDYRAGWGTETFESKVADDFKFPTVWEDGSDRKRAREVIDANLAKLKDKTELRRQVMENGTHIDGPFFATKPELGNNVDFYYDITNTNSGHNVPSGSLGAQPELWLNVALVDPQGNTMWESGYTDRQGDTADQHSQDVLNGKIPFDDQLFNLQTKFLTTNVKGTDREMYLPVNFDVDQIPLLRPAQQPVSVMNHPPGVRMEGRSIPPLGKRKAQFKVPAALIKQAGRYRLAVRMRSRAEPIYFMRFVGATPEMIRSMNEGVLDIHTYATEFEIKP